MVPKGEEARVRNAGPLSAACQRHAMVASGGLRDTAANSSTYYPPPPPMRYKSLQEIVLMA
jgi:hypothetical protein